MYNKKTPFIEYTTNAEYREHLRQIFGMTPPTIENAEEIDEESLDEMLFDNAAVINIMEDIYQQTCGDELFCELYVLAAGKLLTEDKSIGLAIMYSYDYLYLFHALLCLYLTNKENNPEYKLKKDCRYYIQLKQRI